MATVLLIRHGENEYVKKGRLAGRLAGVHLNDRGRSQSETLAENLRHAPITAVYSSPLDRTVETAAPLAKALGQKVIPRPGLLEVDFGTWQDKTLKQLRRRKLWSTVQRHPSQARFPEGESFAEAQIRIAQELIALNSLHKPKELLVAVSHSDIIKLAVAYFMGQPLDLFQRLMVSPASITTIHLGPHGAHLINLNQSISAGWPPPEKDAHGAKPPKK
jgi:probable phosphoglycerate mutase